ncbi:MAG TPA: MmcQ/YjbR family DNA-binding protein [Thermoanaerobaculia bacterium]
MTAKSPSDRTLRKSVDLRGVRRLLLGLPGVEEGPRYGTPGYRVQGRFLARLRDEGKTLVVKCGFDERDLWLQADPQAFFTTDHYRGYPTVLVRLACVDPGTLREVIEQAWRRAAPKRLVKELESSRGSAPSAARRGARGGRRRARRAPAR